MVFNPIQYTVAEDAGQVTFIIEVLTSTERQLNFVVNVSAGTTQGTIKSNKQFSLLC